MAKKFKQIKPGKKDRLYGQTVNGEQWVTNGHWAMRAHMVSLTNEQAACMATAGKFAQHYGGEPTTDGHAPDLQFMFNDREETQAEFSRIMVDVEPSGVVKKGLAILHCPDNPELGIVFMNKAYTEVPESYSLTAYVANESTALSMVRFYNSKKELTAIVMPVRDDWGHTGAIRELHKANEVRLDVEKQKVMAKSA